MAGTLVEFAEFSVHQARNAYSGLLLVPGWDQLRFNVLLKPLKKQWSSSKPKYATFWDGAQMVEFLSTQPLLVHDVEALRERLLIVLRLFMLLPSIDLARTFRTVTVQGSTAFVLIQRKGSKFPMWETVLHLPDSPHLCPWTLLQRYVAMTCSLPGVDPGSPVFITLKPTYNPLQANTLGSLTKKFFEKMGLHLK